MSGRVVSDKVSGITRGECPKSGSEWMAGKEEKTVSTSIVHIYLYYFIHMITLLNNNVEIVGGRLLFCRVGFAASMRFSS